MATIKTQLVGGERRIITKNGLISCSCCETPTGCCMYPASQLGVGYAQADLPDAVTINWAGYSSGSASRSGSTYTVGGTTLAVSGGIWVLTNGGATQNVGACLIPDDGGYTAGDDLVEDQFADTYNYTVVFNGTTLQSGTISRDSLCVWSNKDVPAGFHKGIIYNPETYKFEILDPDELTGDKTSPHNTPVGEYVQGNLGGLYDGAITTIF